jgi:dTMP kinase
MVKPVYRFFSFILPTSKNMFYLDLAPEIAMERITTRNTNKNQKFQSFENIESLKKTREKAKLISADWIIIDGSKDKNEIKEEIKNILLKNK